MLSKLFGKNPNVSIREFITQIKKGERNFFNTLKIKPTDFQDASFDELMSNTDDVLAKVNRVQKNFRTAFFKLFNSCLIKHHDNGDIKFVFYTVTNDAQKVIEFADTLFEELGTGNFDSRRFTPFTNKERIKEISKGIYFQESDELVHLWFLDNVVFLLQYRISPLRQFSLMVTIKGPEEKDLSIRRKGTILDLLKFNIDEILANEPESAFPEFDGNKIKFTDYKYPLNQMEFKVFDVLRIRIFDDVRKFRKNIQTHITLYSSIPIQSDKKVAIAESLIKMYGSDGSTSDELELHERDLIEEGRYWVGRTWRFNEQHGLWDMNNENEKLAYEVRLDDWEDEEGFKISILAYNQLVELFSTDSHNSGIF